MHISALPMELEKAEKAAYYPQTAEYGWEYLI